MCANYSPVDDMNREPSFGERAKDEVKAATSEVKYHAEETARQVRESAEMALERRKESTASGLDTVANSFRAMGQQLSDRQVNLAARYVDLAADQIDHAAQYLRTHHLRELGHDAADFARRHPAIFLGATAAAGILIGRFLRSSAAHAAAQSHAYDEGNGEQWRSGQSTAYGSTSWSGTQHLAGGLEHSPRSSIYGRDDGGTYSGSRAQPPMQRSTWNRSSMEQSPPNRPPVERPMPRSGQTSGQFGSQSSSMGPGLSQMDRDQASSSASEGQSC